MIIAKKKNNSVPRMYLRCTDKMSILVGKHAEMSKLFWQLSFSTFCLFRIAR